MFNNRLVGNCDLSIFHVFPGVAFRHCTPNGTWDFIHSSNKTWANYSDCFLQPDISIGKVMTFLCFWIPKEKKKMFWHNFCLSAIIHKILFIQRHSQMQVNFSPVFLALELSGTHTHTQFIVLHCYITLYCVIVYIQIGSEQHDSWFILNYLWMPNLILLFLKNVFILVNGTFSVFYLRRWHLMISF